MSASLQGVSEATNKKYREDIEAHTPLGRIAAAVGVGRCGAISGERRIGIHDRSR